MTFSFLALCGTLAKTFEVKRAATQAGIKATLTTLLIRDGTAYLLFNFIGNILTIAHKSLNNTVVRAISTSVREAVQTVPTTTLQPGFEVTVGFTTGFVPIIISRLILNLRNIDDQVIQASLPELSQNSSHISSLRIIGNVGAPVSMSLIDTDEDEEDYIPATTTQVSARQIVENPLTVGLFDQRPDSTINRENVGEAWEMGTDLVTKEK
ncbi:hypothetical protein C8Q75DRAFT_752133 [Abortiporus biennis]|nr:hypothetical protein C8Q75DRAFT_752133 [Abortiporus biennis]